LTDTYALRYFIVWISIFAEQNRYVYSQASRSNYREYLRVLN